MGRYYHGTTKDRKDKILSEGFKIGLSKDKSLLAVGDAIYFYNYNSVKDYGDAVITVELDDDKLLAFDCAFDAKEYIVEHGLDSYYIGVKFKTLTLGYFVAVFNTQAIKIIE